MIKKKYDWLMIQREYNAGKSWRDLRNEFGVSFGALQKATKRGDLMSRTPSDALTLYFSKNPAHQMGEEARKRLAEEQSLRNRGGRCKWYNVGGQMVQGTWERDAGIKLTDIGIKWWKVGKTSDEIIWYSLDGKIKAYTPDFYLPEYNVFLEFKGYWWGRDKEKMEAVMSQHPYKRIVVIEKNQFKRLLAGELVWLDCGREA